MELRANGATTAVKQGSHSAHKAIQRAANRTVAVVDRVSGAAHGAIDRVTRMVGKSGQLRATQSQVAVAYRNYVTARPLMAVGTALMAGFLIGRLWRR